MIVQDILPNDLMGCPFESTLVMDSPVLVMHHDPDRSWITDPDPDHLKGMRPKIARLTT